MSYRVAVAWIRPSGAARNALLEIVRSNAKSARGGRTDREGRHLLADSQPAAISFGAGEAGRKMSK